MNMLGFHTGGIVPNSDPLPIVATLPDSPYTAKAVTMASAGGGAGIAIILVWVLSLFNIEVPQSVSLVLGGVLTGIGGMIAHRLPPPLTPEQHQALYDAILARIARHPPPPASNPQQTAPIGRR